MNDLTELKVRIDGHVAILTMDSAPVNALTRVLNDELTLALDRIGDDDELTLALDRIGDDDEIRVVVLTGAGRVFCAGADLKGRAGNIRGLGDLSAHARRTREYFHAIRECAKPVIAAINGAALGSGRRWRLPVMCCLPRKKPASGCPRLTSACRAGGATPCACSAIRACVA